ncbi:hypothetical protein L0Y69_00830 [bacterium]|nr:hypothetical protein [bacterium]
MRRIIYQHTEIQIVFKSDAGLKELALEKTRMEGITLKAMLTMAMRAYVNDELEVFLGKRAAAPPPLPRGGARQGGGVILSPTPSVLRTSPPLKRWRGKK